jgi:hypothetical protein
MFALIGLVWALGSGCRPGPEASLSQPTDQLLNVYSVGLARLAGDTNAAKLRDIGRLPETKAILDRALQRITVSLIESCRSAWPALNPRQAHLLLPLWADLAQAETWFSAYGQQRKIDEWTLALRLKGDRTTLWNTNLWQALAATPAAKTTQLSPATAVAPNWEVRLTNATGVFRLVAVSNWCVVAWARDKAVATDKFIRQLKGGWGPPATTNWLVVSWDWETLPVACCPTWFPGRQPGSTPRGFFSLSGSSGYLRSHLALAYPREQSWNLERWNVPTNLLREPMVSFAAIQGFGSWLARNEKARLLEWDAFPNQLYVWALLESPFQTYAAFPVKDGSNSLARLANRAPDLIKACFPPRGVGALVMLTNQSTIQWRGLPFIVPYIHPEKGPEVDYLAGGLLPVITTNITPMDPQLAAQIQGRTNVLWYEWEITQERLLQLQVLVPLLGLLAEPAEEKTTDAATEAHLRLITEWIRAIAPRLGNAVTEAVVVSPKDLNISRKSHLGLNSSEIIALSRWLSQPEFIPGRVAPSAP